MLIACVVTLASMLQLQRELSAIDRHHVLHILHVVISAVANRGEYAAMARALLRQVAPWRDRWPAPASALLDELQRDTEAGRVFQLGELR